MKLFIINQTAYVYGGRPSTALISDFVSKRLATYGRAADTIFLTLIYPSRSINSSSPFVAELNNLAKRCPRVTFFRQKQLIKTCGVCRNIFSIRSITSHGHLTMDEVDRLIPKVAECMQQIEPRIRPTDDFDFPRFLADASKALKRCSGNPPPD